MMSTSLTYFLFGSLLIGVNGAPFSFLVNSHATLPCSVTNPENITVRWYKNPTTMLSMGMNMTHAFKKRMRIVQPYNGEWNLQIDHVQLGDAGEYSCRVGNDVIHQFDLIVETPPKIHVTPDMTFQEGDTGTLWCNVTGYPTPEVRWSWKSQHQNEGMGQNSGAQGNRLVLHNITRYYENVYVCNAGHESRYIRINVTFGPEVEVFQNTVTAKLREEVTLHCAVAANPMDGELEWVFQNKNSILITDWKYDVSTDETMKKDYYTIFNSLTIRENQLEDGDYGSYVCRTKNFSGGHSEKGLFIQKPKEQEAV